jgi:FkbM family methyltransferase
MLTSKTVYAKSYGRAEAFRWLLLYPSYRQFVKNASSHIRQRRQMAVFSFDHISLEINANGMYERKELETFFSWIDSIQPGLFREAAALDLGANIGNHSLFFADHFKHVHAFEPNGRTFQVLKLNAELVGNVTCHQVGLSDTAGSASFSFNAANIGASCIVPAVTAGATKVRLTTLDAALPEAENIKLIKIDVEGHDYQALLGAEVTIKTHHPIILFEHFSERSKTGETPTMTLLRSYGYQKFAVIRGHPRAPSFFTPRIRLVTETFLRILCGESMGVELDDRPQGFHSMVIAIPKWLNP